jgi:hypothetical protein
MKTHRTAVLNLVSLACVAYPALANAQDREHGDRDDAARYSISHFTVPMTRATVAGVNGSRPDGTAVG